MKSLTPKKPAKDQRERLILFGLVDLYLQYGKPIGSNTLRENGFEALSSATIRNYFAKLEEEGLVKQQHSSGGRIPTAAAYKLYAEAHFDQPRITAEEKKQIAELLKKETREVASYLLQATEKISEITSCAAFLSSPRFDQDFILEIKLLYIDHSRLLSVLVTDFGMIRTEVLYTDKKLSNFTLKRLESYFNWRLTGIDKPSLDPEEETLGARLYKELMLRHIVSYTNFSSEDLFQAGFSKLLAYPDFNDAAALASGLSLFENKQMLRKLLSSATESGKMVCLIGDDLIPFSPEASACSVIAVPYRINQTLCGAFGILGPSRIPYRELFGQLKQIAESISDSLTKSVYKFKISFRSPKPSNLEFQKNHPGFLDQSQTLLLEDQTNLEENR
ncbi:MAG: heat-inducible transcriptional repressor HrcA [Verrucomicrobia bacterium]|nr:heat-inducible transcriptional repressor HrcA [Verrucomicrobiota bacterium]